MEDGYDTNSNSISDSKVSENQPLGTLGDTLSLADETHSNEF